jgi:hypothetical protein
MFNLPNLIGGFAALVALASSTLIGIDPVQCLVRGLVAYLVGKTLGHLWCGFADMFHNKIARATLKVSPPKRWQEENIR